MTNSDKIVQYPETVVGAFIFNPRHELLLMRSHKWQDRYVVPGGHIELGESLEAALRREIKEETGLEIYDIRFLHLDESIFDSQFHTKRHFIFLDHVCRTHSDVVVLNNEGQSYIWADWKTVQHLSLESYTQKTLLAHEEELKSHYFA